MSVPNAAFVLASLGLLVLASLTLAWMLYAWRDADAAERTTAQHIDLTTEASALSFSLLAPARHEEHVFGRTLDGLAALDHPRFEVIAIVGHDDDRTAAVARAAAARHPGRIKVVVDYHESKNKPRALNTALPCCTGDVVGVFDAEDVVHPQLLKAVERRMLADRAGAVQAGVQLMNFWSSWYSVRNVLEYYFWFRSRLHFQADRGFIPLGGNTVFIRRPLLQALGGWDGDCLAEDCDLGVRLSARGFTTSVVYDPRIVTREETPATLTTFIKQRTRWNQGFLQVLYKRDWALLPTWRQRTLALFTLCTPFLQATTGILLPLSLASIVLLSMPAWMTLLAFLPLAPSITTLVIEHLALAEFGRLFGQRVRLRDHVRLAVGTPVFQAVLAVAALRAVIRHLRGRHAWEKTEHLGLHLSEAQA